MAETQTHVKEDGKVAANAAPKGPKSGYFGKRGPSIHQIYARPAPIRTFPLPAFYPNNPISFFTVGYAWLKQVLSPPPSEPSVVHHGIWSEATTSIHVVDETSMRALWEQGFYGKGSLSRSEPNWLKREQVRRGLQESHVSEILTVQRREERAQAKWERARQEQEAIRQTRLKESQLAEATKMNSLVSSHDAIASFVISAAPVGPLELLALPNSNVDLARNEPVVNGNKVNSTTVMTPAVSEVIPVLREDALPSGKLKTNGDVIIVDASSPYKTTSLDLYGGSEEAITETLSINSIEEKTLKRQKSVRFSPKVESTTYNLGDPPSPSQSLDGNKSLDLNGDVNEAGPAQDVQKVTIDLPESDKSNSTIVNKEHLQLTPEEAYFLAFGFGALSVTDPQSGHTLTAKQLLTLFRQHSYFPPRNGPDEPDLEPDDGFLVHYAVYHHFRSLGWVPRAGIKFGVDWLLYAKGPVFDHAEFGVIVIPSYSSPWWKARGKQGPRKTWPWLHSIVRVLSHVLKSLVLVYVDIPPPPKFEAALELGYAEALKLYKVREVVVKRWSSNRNR